MYGQNFDIEFYAGQAWPGMPFGLNGDFDHARQFERVFARQKPRWVRPRQKNNRPGGTPTRVRATGD